MTAAEQAARRGELLTVQEFADVVRMRPHSIYRRIWRDRQPGVVHIGREIRIDISIALPRPAPPAILT